MKRTFRKNNGEKVEDVVQYIKNYIKNDDPSHIWHDIYIGCDSQVSKRHTHYSVVIGIHRFVDGVGKGVHIIHTREKDKKLGDDMNDIIRRLWSEIERIVDTAIYLRESGIDIDDFSTHVDANVKEKYASNKIYNAAIGWLSSLGFKVEGKPYAWAATYAANRYCR